jgi:hypothetical protein
MIRNADHAAAVSAEKLSRQLFRVSIKAGRMFCQGGQKYFAKNEIILCHKVNPYCHVFLFNASFDVFLCDRVEEHI